jgi:hypothetical protein
MPSKGSPREPDERTRTADLPITSDNSGVAGVCLELQFLHRLGDFLALAYPVLHRIAFAVVSEWCCVNVTLKFDFG